MIDTPQTEEITQDINETIEPAQDSNKNVEATQPVAVINIDSVPYSLNDLPDEIQRLVQIYEMWSKEENTTQLELMKLQTAKSSLSNQIIDMVKAEQAARTDPAE